MTNVTVTPLTSGAVVVEYAAPKGPPGPSGAVGGRFTQSFTNSNTWVVNHNLGREVIVSVYSVGGVLVYPEVNNPTTNQTVVNFDASFSGYVVIF